jgi:hypothetical protein
MTVHRINVRGQVDEDVTEIRLAGVPDDFDIDIVYRTGTPSEGDTKTLKLVRRT